MLKRALWWLGGGAGTAALLYWQLVLAEGSYLGPWAVRLVYSLGARHYDAVRALSQTHADAVLQQLMTEALRSRSAPAILDVATGTGRVPLLLHPDPARAGLVAALDLTPPMLAEARRKERTFSPAARTIWHVGEAGNLPWRANVFDLVTCLEALEYFPRPRQALAEIVRVLRPGAALIVSKVPDNWARLLPGRALNRETISHALASLGCVALQFIPWQHGHYELVLARRGPEGADG